MIVAIIAFAFSLGSEIDVFFTLCFNPAVTTETVVQILKDALNLNGTFGSYRAGRLALLEDDSTTSTTPGSHKPTGKRKTLSVCSSIQIAVLLMLMSFSFFFLSKSICFSLLF